MRGFESEFDAVGFGLLGLHAEDATRRVLRRRGEERSLAGFVDQADGYLDVVTAGVDGGCGVALAYQEHFAAELYQRSDGLIDTERHAPSDGTLSGVFVTHSTVQSIRGTFIRKI